MSSNILPTILLVDDNHSNLLFLIDHLHRKSFQLMVAESGTSALARVATRKPDLILLDVSMPGMDGYETCRHLKADPDSADIPILFLSAFNEPGDKLEGYAAGGADYISKPVDLAELVARINTHLTMHRMRKELQERNSSLAERVARKTDALKNEINERRQSELEKQALLGLVEQQQNQINEVTEKIRDSDPDENNSTGQSAMKQILGKLALIRTIIESIALTTTNSRTYSLVNSSANEAIKLFDEVETIYQTLPTINDPERMENHAKGQAILSTLSTRERQVFELIVAGLSNEEIAEHTHITKSTVRTYKLRVLKKLGVTNVPDLVRLAMRTSS